MSASDNGKIQRLQGGDILNVVTGGQFQYNSTQLTMNSLSTALATTTHSTVAANNSSNMDVLGSKINAVAGQVNDLTNLLRNLGIIAAT